MIAFANSRPGWCGSLIISCGAGSKAILCQGEDDNKRICAWTTKQKHHSLFEVQGKKWDEVATNMNDDLVSKKTRNEFREFLVNWKLRDIRMVYDAVGIGCNQQYKPDLSGERRSCVEQHYYTLDFTDPADVNKLLQAYEEILNTTSRELPTQFDKEYLHQTIEKLVACLKKDGFKYQNDKITSIAPETRKVFDDTPSGRSISEVTRRQIIDTITVEEIPWWGELPETKFLERLYDIDSLPSSDSRFNTAAGDIWQHRENNPDDWPDEWVFTDSRFDLIHASDEAFLRFLCEMVHPVVRPNTPVVIHLVNIFNHSLAVDKWEIVPKTQISGKPIFAARRMIKGSNTALKGVKSVVASIDTHYVTKQITRMESAIDPDPESAIGTAKDFVETICKTILQDCGQTLQSNDDLLQLVKKVRKELDLLPENIPDKAKGADTIKRLLSNLATVAQGLAELRNLYGSGHGKSAKATGLQPRHARLAVNAACTLGVFLFETYQQRNKPSSTKKEV